LSIARCLELPPHKSLLPGTPTATQFGEAGDRGSGNATTGENNMPSIPELVLIDLFNTLVDRIKQSKPGQHDRQAA
jgi:hypothetical protein